MNEPLFTNTNRRSGIMLAYPFEEKRLSKWQPPYIVQPKLDGERCRAIISPDGAVALYSSECNLIESVPHINKALQDLALEHGLRGVELDGELYSPNLPLQKIHSVVSRKCNLHPSFEEVEYYLFDLVNLELSQVTRLSKLLGLPGLSKPPMHTVPIQICHTYNEILDRLSWSLSQGFEGIIVRHMEAKYVRKRSIYMMKFKPKREDLYEIVGTLEEISQLGVPKNSLGAIVCKSHDSDELFNVGSGFTFEQRRELWQRREELVGKLVRIKYQSLTSTRGVPYSAVFDAIIEEYKSAT